jgi:hypothetical protein
MRASPQSGSIENWRFARGFWTIGSMVLLVHVLMAFHLVHGWNHTRAYLHTAERTVAITGLRWGGGLYLNYLLTVLWVVDTCWWWIRPRTYLSRPRYLDWALHGFMGFMFVNAVIVFGSGYLRWAILAMALMLTAAWFFAVRTSDNSGK